MQDQPQERPRKTQVTNLREDTEKTAVSLVHVLRKVTKKRIKAPQYEKIKIEKKPQSMETHYCPLRALSAHTLLSGFVSSDPPIIEASLGTESPQES